MKALLFLLALCVSAQAQNIDVGDSREDMLKAMARNKNAKVIETEANSVTYSGWTIAGVVFDRCTFLFKEDHVSQIIATRKPAKGSELAAIVKAYKKIYGKGERGFASHSWKHEGRDITAHILMDVLRILK